MDVLKKAKASHEVSDAFFAAAKNICFSVFPQRQTFRLKDTVSYNTRLLVFEMALFFFVTSKNLNIGAVLFSSQFFPIPRVKKSFSTRKTI